MHHRRFDPLVCLLLWWQAGVTALLYQPAWPMLAEPAPGLAQVFMLIAGLWRQSARDRASDILLLEADPQKDLAKKAITVFKHSGAMYSYLVQQHLAEDIAGSVERCCKWYLEIFALSS